jgi:hypothetical protein
MQATRTMKEEFGNRYFLDDEQKEGRLRQISAIFSSELQL